MTIAGETVASGGTRGARARRSRSVATAVALGATIALVLGACSSSGDSATTATDTAPATTVVPADVTVTGPITGGTRGVAYSAMPPGVADRYGYTEEEYFVAGTAPSYTPAAPLTEDGKWTVNAGPEAPYEVRVIVRRPANPDDFNGKVVVEWNNVTAGFENQPVFSLTNDYLMREGYAYVGVSAQQGGIDGLEKPLEVPGAPPEVLLALKQWDPQRYGALIHPGDAWSYGIYTDVADMLRAPGAVDPLGGLVPEGVIAAGQSQSAGRMVTYANAVQPVTGAYDGFLVHSRGDSASPLGPTDADKAPAVVKVRTDLDAPVLVFQTETEAARSRALGFRQPDTTSVRVWEVTGTAHADQATLDFATAAGKRWTTLGYDPTPYCGTVNNGPSGSYVITAIDSLDRWIADGTAPPSGPPIQVTDGKVVRAADGIALGGIRSPAVDAPISILSGEGNPSSVFCSLFGQRTDFTPEQLVGLYGDHTTYVAKVTTSADESVKAGFLLPAERDKFVATAEASRVAR